MHKIADIATGVLMVAGIMVMVRPNSQGPSLVTAITGGFGNVIGAATGGGTFNAPKTK
jgi:hypothetical protein